MADFGLELEQLLNEEGLVTTRMVTVTVTLTVTVILFKCPKNKRPRGLPLDIRLSRLHLELPYMQNILAHGTPPRSHGTPPRSQSFIASGWASRGFDPCLA